MAAIIRVLGQVYPAANTETTLYTCGTTSAVISTINICNTSPSAADSFTVRICIAGAGDTNSQLLAYLVNLPPGTFLPVTVGLTVASTDVIKVLALNGTCSFQLLGQENS